MDAHKALITNIFNNSTLVEVPFFQRSYVWKEDLWGRLLEDMEFVVKTKKPHFLGSIILKEGRKPRQGENFADCRTIVDGQQRLTTFLIFMKVLCLKLGQTALFDCQFRIMQIVDNSRKILFMSGKEIHWHANVWYMERFNFAPERVNPSNPVQRLSFYEVTNERNRELLQEYMKYQVGIGDLALGNIRNQLCYIKKFLVYFNTFESICEITEEQIAEYFKLLQEAEIKAETVNRQIFDIHRFFVYLNAKGHIKGKIFDPNYYSQKVFPSAAGNTNFGYAYTKNRLFEYKRKSIFYTNRAGKINYI